MYKIECWGASGGNATHVGRGLYHYGGNGGYASGIFKFNISTNLSARIGGKGLSDAVSSEAIPGGFNGGGSAGCGSGKLNTASGGGATDIRLNGDSIYNRIIVAGGGGGAAITNSYNNEGGHGGGEIAGDSTGIGSKVDSYVVFGASQTYPGYTKSTDYPGTNGTLGYGGAGIVGNHESSSGGGGGGFFGGGGGGASGGSGGSAFVSQIASNITMISGSLPMPSPTSNSTETSHQGNGFIRITTLVLISSPISYYCRIGTFGYQILYLEVLISK